MQGYRSFSLIDRRGQRKYLNAAERQRFYKVTLSLSLEKSLFCQMLYYTGARISEISELRVPQIDFTDKTVILRTLKQRKDDVYRQIPLPEHLLDRLLAFLDISRKELGQYELGNQKIWPFSVRTASRIVKTAMNQAKVYGICASAKGLRHGFAVHGVTKVPLTQIQIWMGHSSVETTGIYLQVSGLEERAWAERMWDINVTA